MTQAISEHIIREQRKIEKKRRMVLLIFAIACLVGLVFGCDDWSLDVTYQ